MQIQPFAFFHFSDELSDALRSETIPREAG